MATDAVAADPKSAMEHQESITERPDSIHNSKHVVRAHGDILAQEALGDDLPPGYFTSLQFWGTAFGVGLSCGNGYLGWVLASNSLTAINAELGPSEDLLWLPLAYIVTSAVGWVLFGRLSDIFGRRWFYISGDVLGLIGCIIAATAQNMSSMIVSNVFIGFGAAIQQSYGTVIQELVPLKARGVMAAFVLTAVTPGAVFGPIIAKSFIANTGPGWRWDYYLTIITNVVAGLLLVLFYHPPTFEMLHMGKTRWQKVKSLDYGGIFIFMAGEVLFLLGINWGGQLYPWKSAQVIVCIILGFFIIVALVFYEAYVPSDPLIPVSLLRNVQFMMFVVCACIGGMIYYALGIVWPQTVSYLYTTDLIHQGWLSVSATGGNQLGNICCGLAFATIGHVRYQLIVATICMTAFVAALASTTQHTQSGSIALSIIGTFFAGFVEVIPIVSIPFTVKPEDIGLSIGVMGAIRASAGAIATAVYVSILNNRNSSLSAKYIPKAVLEAGLPKSSLPALFKAILAGTADALAAVPGFNAAVGAALGLAQKNAFSGALKTVFLATISFGACGIIAAFFVKNIDHLLTDDVVRKLHRRDVKEIHEAVVRDEEKEVPEKDAIKSVEVV